MSLSEALVSVALLGLLVLVSVGSVLVWQDRASAGQPRWVDGGTVQIDLACKSSSTVEDGDDSPRVPCPAATYPSR